MVVVIVVVVMVVVVVVVVSVVVLSLKPHGHLACICHYVNQSSFGRNSKLLTATLSSF